MDTSRKKLSAENIDLSRQLEDSENQVAQLNKLRVSYAQQLADVQKLADDEAKVSLIQWKRSKLKCGQKKLKWREKVKKLFLQ